MRRRRCYYCERVGTRGFELVDGLDACANLDACNERSHRLWRRRLKAAERTAPAVPTRDQASGGQA